MRLLLANILLALTWVALMGEFSIANFVVGLVLGYAGLWMARYVLQTTNHVKYFGKLWKFFTFFLYFSKEVILSNLQVAYNVVAPNSKMSPGVVAIPLDIEEDAEITLLANVITLTPGTLSLDVSDDKRTLYIHAMNVGDDVEAFRQSIKDGFEKRVHEVFE